MADYLPILAPSRNRILQLNSTTALVLRSDQNTRVNVVAGAVNTTNFDIDSGASATADIYVGLYGAFTVGKAAGTAPWLITDYGNGGANRVTVGTALTTQPDTTTTFVIGRSLPPAWSSLYIAATGTGNIYYSLEPGGATDANRRFTLFNTQSKLWSSVGESRPFDYIEILSVAATDTASFEWA